MRRKRLRKLSLSELLPTDADRRKALRRLMDKIEEVHGDLSTPCWIWRASMKKSGGGRFGVKGVIYSAYRAAWFLIRGFEVKAPLQLNHVCHGGAASSGCVRPDHIYVGTHADNMRDAKEGTRRHR